jgi:hypothetical protein
MDLDDAVQRQAVIHAVADGIAGVTRLQIVDEVYDAKYWADYRAGQAAFEQAQAGASEPGWYRPEPVRATPVYQPAANGPDDGRAFATRMLDELLASGECTLAPTVVENYAAGRMREIERQWAAEPPEGFLDGPEAG